MSWWLSLDSIPVLSSGFLHDSVCEGDPRGGSLWVVSCMEETSSCADKAHAFLQTGEFRRQKDGLEPVVKEGCDIRVMCQEVERSSWGGDEQRDGVGGVAQLAESQPLDVWRSGPAWQVERLRGGWRIGGIRAGHEENKEHRAGGTCAVRKRRRPDLNR